MRIRARSLTARVSGVPEAHRSTYALRGKTYRLYSVRPDRKDDGGAPIKWRDGESGANSYRRFPSLMLDSTGDYVAGANR